MSGAFTIRSTELRDYSKKHRCTVLDVINSASNHEKIIVGVDPPIPGYIYDCANDFNQVIISPRFAGTTLLPEASEWPFRVYICAPQIGGDWTDGPLRILDWGVLERIDEDSNRPLD
jgi:hypothetical protein